jgi:hypothetical protein
MLEFPGQGLQSSSFMVRDIPAAFDGLLPPLHDVEHQIKAVCLPSTGVSQGLSDFGPNFKSVRGVVRGLVKLKTGSGDCSSVPFHQQMFFSN